MDDFLVQVGVGIMSGFFVAGAGYLKSYDSVGVKEKIDGIKFLKTVILGAIVGGSASVTGMTPEAIMALPAYVGITAIVENGLKAIYRKIWGVER